MSGGSAGSWRELRSFGAVVVVLAGGVLVGAVSIYLAAAVLPTAVQQLGGADLYAWNTTAFLVGQVASAMVTAFVLRAVGSRTAYTAGFGLFALGSVVCTVAPVMPVMLAGRGVQGLGAGLLTGLGFAMVQATLPSSLWSRGSAVISTMFGLGNFIGPAAGGALAQAGAWRAAFAALAVSAVLLGLLARGVLAGDAAPAAPPRTEYRLPRVPLWSLGAVVAATGALSVAGLATSAVHVVGFVAVAAVLLAGFVVVERRGPSRVLPAPTYRGGSSMRWVYLTIAVLAAGVAVETFLPLFGQLVVHLPPLVAGFYGAALSLGWASAQLLSASARGPGVTVMIVLGPAVLAAGLAALAVLVVPDASVPVVVGWLVALVVAGAGIGMAMPHLTVRAMSLARNPAEAQQAAASVATVLTMATATGSAVAGLLVSLGQPDLVTSARYLFIGFAALSVFGSASARLVTSHAAP